LLLYIPIAILAVIIIIRVIVAYEHQLCLILLEWLQAHVERRYRTQTRAVHFAHSRPPAATPNLASRGRS
jgi:hypothetical protein